MGTGMQSQNIINSDSLTPPLLFLFLCASTSPKFGPMQGAESWQRHGLPQSVMA